MKPGKDPCQANHNEKLQDRTYTAFSVHLPYTEEMSSDPKAATEHPDSRSANGSSRTTTYADTSVLAAYYCLEPLSILAERTMRRLPSPMIRSWTGQGHRIAREADAQNKMWPQ